MDRTKNCEIINGFLDLFEMLSVAQIEEVRRACHEELQTSEGTQLIDQLLDDAIREKCVEVVAV